MHTTYDFHTHGRRGMRSSLRLVVRLIALILSVASSALSVAYLAAGRITRPPRAIMSLKGEVFIFSPVKRLAAFRSTSGSQRSTSTSSAACGRQDIGYAIFVPGLTDGLMALAYIPALAASLDRLGFSFVQPVLSSSYQGYGTSSLRQDVEELDELLAYLLRLPPRESATPAKSQAEDQIILIGHSTGCQDAVFYMKYGRPELRKRVRGVVLQAPVSDREWLETRPDTKAFIAEARVRGGGEELMPRAASDAPITAARFLSLATKEGDDDMFSTDLSIEERRSRLGHMAHVPTAAFLSGADEFVPPGGCRSPPEALAEWFRVSLSTPAECDRFGETEADASWSEKVQHAPIVHVIDGGNHALSDERHAAEFVERVEGFVSGLGP